MMETNRAVVSSMYDRVVRQSLGLQLITACLVGLLLDGGVAARVVGVSLLGFWISVGILMVRRPLQPTKYDLAFVKWGFLPVLLVAVLVQISVK